MSNQKKQQITDIIVSEVDKMIWHLNRILTFCFAPRFQLY